MCTKVIGDFFGFVFFVFFSGARTFPHKSPLLTMNLTPERSRARDVVKVLKTTRSMLILPRVFPCSTQVFHFGEKGRRDGSEREKEGGMECAALTVFIAQCSDQNYQCTTK